ncbi:hypothetical protein SZN_32096 [Streptomyces zinciresistens K42]|uniref:Uncharacterized protein n=1 Tax=Streptomyces zinciresistens K42 TaxID=700597 RepID=G2GLM1_9ACTN|nr:hypothetical protein SZN_32096 [Streptomyces zinciresistens K42]
MRACTRALYRACGCTEIPAYGDHVCAGHRFGERLHG